MAVYYNLMAMLVGIASCSNAPLDDPSLSEEYVGSDFINAVDIKTFSAL